MRKWFIFVVFLSILFLAACYVLYRDNYTVGVTHYTVESEKIPAAFDGYKILQISDLQGMEFGADNKDLISKIKKQDPDMIVITGDLIDEGVAGSEEVAERLLADIGFIDERYAVSGNHDKWTGRFDELMRKWESRFGIHFLENKSVVITKEGESINLCGIADPDRWADRETYPIVEDALGSLKLKDGYNILLFHRANMLDLFKESGFDLILSGHIHGGQIRIPFIGGLKSPHGDWFPKYSGGKEKTGDQVFIISRGLGNAVNVPRVLNRPEIVVVTLKSK